MIACIVTPSFNQAQFIGTTIKSVLSQQYPHHLVKYVIFDAMSTDQTSAVVHQYKKKLTFISEADRGQSDAINKGIAFFEKELSPAQKKNAFFAYLNSDDYYLHEKTFQIVAEAFKKNPHYDWLVGDAVIVNEHGKEIQPIIRTYKKILRKLSPSILHIANPYPQPAVFLRWKAVEKVGAFNQALRYTMDYEYWLRVLTECGPPLQLTPSISAFRIHTASKGSTAFFAQFKEELAVARQLSPSWALPLHNFHNLLITSAYSILKK